MSQAWTEAHGMALQHLRSPGQVQILTIHFAPAAPAIDSVYPVDDIDAAVERLR